MGDEQAGQPEQLATVVSGWHFTLLAGNRFDLTWLTFSAGHMAGHQFWDLSQADDGLDAATRRDARRGPGRPHPPQLGVGLGLPEGSVASSGVIPRRTRVEESAAREVAMEDREPTVRSRELGEGLREAMERAGLNGREDAYLLPLVTELGVATAVRQARRQR